MEREEVRAKQREEESRKRQKSEKARQLKAMKETPIKRSWKQAEVEINDQSKAQSMGRQAEQMFDSF